jgi:hypothetical protein
MPPFRRAPRKSRAGLWQSAPATGPWQFASKEMIQDPPVCKSTKREHSSSEMKRIFPGKSLVRPQEKHIGDSNRDYGGHAGTLNILTKLEETSRRQMNRELGIPEIETQIGRVSIGVTYENDQKKVNSAATMCQKSKKLWPYIQATEESLKLSLKSRSFKGDTSRSFLKYLRVSGLAGASTLMHTDSYRGYTHNYVMFHDVGCHLRIHLFPKFRTSVVVLFGRLYIPVSYSTIYGIRVYGLPLSAGCDEFNEDTHVTKLLIPAEALSYFQPYGDLPYAVVGTKKENGKNRLQIDDAPEGWEKHGSKWHGSKGHGSKRQNDRVCKTPKDLSLVSLNDAFQKAAKCRQDFPYRRTHEMSKTNLWHQFTAWQFAHEVRQGTNTLARRTHAYTRLIREVPTGANYNYKQGNPMNFVKVTMEDLKEESNQGSYLGTNIEKIVNGSYTSVA